MEAFADFNSKKKEVARIVQRRRQILVYFYMCHELKSPVVSEEKFHGWCQELLMLQKKYPVESKFMPYYEEFRHFMNGSDFIVPYHKYSWIMQVASVLLGKNN